MTTPRYKPPAYKPPVAGSFLPDVLNVTAGYAAGAEEGQPAQAEVQIVRLKDGSVYWRVKISDLRGGLNRTVGDVMQDFDRVSSSTLEHRAYRRLILPQLTTNAATPDPTGDLVGIHHANIFDALAVACGSGANVSLLKETSAADPTLTALTYTPTTSITGLVPIVIGGATAAQRLAVLRAGTVAQVLSDLATTPTSAGTMHANTNPGWGMIQTPINTDAILIYSNASIYSLLKTAAITDAPTQQLASVPNGGYALGMLALGGGPLRAYWVWPNENNTSGMLKFGAEKPGKVVSTNLEGTDPQELKLLNHQLGNRVIWAMIANDGIIASDGERIAFHNGHLFNLDWTKDREADSDKVYRCRGFLRNGRNVVAEVNQQAGTGGTGNTKRWLEEYDFRTGAWTPLSGQTTLTTTGSLSVGGAGGLPLSIQNRFTHVYADGSWRRIYIPDPEVDSFALRKTSGAQAGTGNAFEPSGTTKSTSMEIPGIEGWPKVVRRMIFAGDVDAGGTGGTPATVAVSAGGVTGTFVTGFSGQAQVRNFADNVSPFYRLQVQWTLTQQSGGTDPTRFTPNGLPVIIEGYAYPEGLPNLREDQRPENWA